LLTDEQLKQNQVLQNDIQNGIDKTNALVANGTAFRSSADELKAQLLQALQSKVEIEAMRKSYADMLSVFINYQIDSTTFLVEPESPALTDSINRPEIILYDYQKKVYNLQDNLLSAQLRPKFNFFFQGGYSRPGLNFLNNNFSSYYIGGLRMNWNIGSLYTYKNQKNILDINRQTLDVEKENFLFNTRITQKQQNNDINKYQELLKQDDAIIALRESVKNAASAQLENGVLTAHDYITQVDADDQARQNKVLHHIQLLQAEFSYKVLTGH
jgi:outer membrane protein TolC